MIRLPYAISVHCISEAQAVLNHFTWHDFGGKKDVPYWKRTVVGSLRDLNVFEQREDKDYVQVFDDDIRSCTFCRLPEIELGSKLKKCVCRTGAAYCNSETCQTLHWKWGGHKKIHHAAMKSRTTE